MFRLLSVVAATVIAAFSMTWAPLAVAEGPTLPMAEVGEDGLHVEQWFHKSFLDLKEDLADANAEGKRLVIIWEQRGCPYCKSLHEVNLRIPSIAKKMQTDFYVLQLNLWGDREVTDFDGQVLKEKELAEKWGVMFTPTLQFFPETAAEVEGKSGKAAEVVRIPGYFKPFHFYFLLHYAKTKGYEQERNFQRWLGGMGNKLDARKIHYDIYADELPDNLPDDL